ncbi:MAG: glucose-1-phosphate adenylyltransferase [Saprospiraceae bacterium]|nr:glucose-1-phosphate adenylyltransferase [Saprospiraceae bacterium]
MIKMVCMILGGGAGSRLYPLTQKRSKPAVPIAGKYRLIDIPISNCLNSGVKRMYVLTQFNSASLNKHIKNTYNFDNFSHGFVDILAAEQSPSGSSWYQGTADAVRQCMRHITNQEYDYILILSGDQLYQMDLEEFARYHISKDADITIATIPVNASDAPGFGIMKVNQDGYIKTFIEKPDASLLPNWESPVSEDYKAKKKVYLASMGIYIFSKNVIKELFKDNPDSNDFGKEIIPSAIESGRTVAGYQYGGYWEDIGTIKSFFDANLALTDNIPDFNLFDNDFQVYTNPRMLAPSKIENTQFSEALLAEGCIIHASKITKSVIGIRSRIGHNSILNRVSMFGSDFYETIEDIVRADQTDEVPIGVGDNCRIENVIIDKNVRIGDDVHIRGGEGLENTETDLYRIVDGIIVLKKSSTIPNGSRIGLAYKD